MKTRFVLVQFLAFFTTVLPAYHAAAAAFDPVILGRWSELAGKDVRMVKVAGEFVYLPEGTNLHLINVANPANPVRVGKYSSPQKINDVAVVGTYAFLAAGEAGLEILDVGNPAAPRRVGAYTGTADEAFSAESLVATETHAYVGGKDDVRRDAVLLILDVQNPALPIKKAWVSSSMVPDILPDWNKIFKIFKSGDYLFIPSSGQLHILNVNTPSLPWWLVSYVPSPRLGLDIPWGLDHLFEIDVATSGELLLAIFGFRKHSDFEEYFYHGLEIIDFAYPGDPQHLGRYLTFANVNGVAASSNYAYLATDAGILVIDVSDPTNPRRAGGNHQFPAQAVAVRNDKLYAVGEQGLFILQVPGAGGPARPQFVAPIQMTRNGARIALSGPRGQTAYIQRSSNLSQWEDWLSVKLMGQPVEVTDEEAVSQHRRFYRLVLK